MEEMKEEPSGSMREGIFLQLIAWIAVGVFLGLGAYYLFFTQVPLEPPQPNVTPPPPPPPEKVTIKMISYSGCTECNSSVYLLEQIQSLAPQFGLTLGDVSTIDSNSQEAQSLISKYSLKRLPTLVISKEAGTSSDFVSGWANLGTKETDGSFVYRNVYPPYYDIDKGRVSGIVDVVEITAHCKECYNSSQFIDYLGSENVAMLFRDRSAIASNSSAAQDLITKYNITRLPTFLLSPDASAYPFMNQTWSLYGSVETDGWHVYQGAFPPYIDLEKNGSVEGLVSLVELVDPNCTNCYDVGLHYSGLMQSFGMAITNRSTVNTNSSQGQDLISRYSITKVPTVVLSSNALIYPGFNDSWAQMGSIEPDGWLVFRELDALGVNYTNVSSAINTSS